MKKLKRVINIALHDGIISRNPFANYTLHLENIEVNFLSIDEIKVIHNKQFENQRLQKVKDIFIFSCMTGLAYIDCKTFDYSKHITRDEGDPRSRTQENRTMPVTDLFLVPLDAKERPILLDIIEDRHERKSIIVTSQLPVADWYDAIGEPTVADAILDRIVHTAHHRTNG